MDKYTLVDETTWLHSIKIELAEATAPQISNWSICWIPHKLRSVNKEAYTPRVLSIGPAHHGKPELHSMEKQKLQYAQSLFGRSVRNTIAPFDQCAKSILDLVHEIRGCYEESVIGGLEDDDLAKIMLIDGCFILELFLRYASGRGQEFRNDPIFTTSWMIHSLQRDLVLLENQIPFIVLDQLYHIVRQSVPDLSRPLNEFALNLFKSPLNLRITEEHNQISCAHLLDLIHKCYEPASGRAASRVSVTRVAPEPIESATFLLVAGIRFRSADNPFKGLLDLEFSQGVLRVPKFIIDDLTVALFTNLVAFEQCCRRDAVQYISSYIILMDLLLNTAADAELLDHMRIVKNNLGSYIDLSIFLKDLSRQIFLREFYFQRLCQKVMVYCNRPWIRYRALLLEHYFKSPWTFVAVLAGSLLLVLTLIQTFISIQSYIIIKKK